VSVDALHLPATVTICEVGPRDGLQNESVTVSSADKVRYIEMLVAAGFRAIEVASFVNPKAVPQLADAEEVCAQLTRVPGCRFIALVPNERGLVRALAAQVDAIGVFTAASDSFTKRNIGMTIEESLATFAPVVERAKAEGLYVRASISTAFGCPFEGAVPIANVVRVAQRLLAIGADELSVADTIGVATPNQVFEIVAALTPHVPLERLGLHFHDTRGTALANILAGLQAGVTIYDSSAGGLGGCPFAPGATGNAATEDVLYLLTGMGIDTGIDLAKVCVASRFIGEKLAGRT
jgi:hydroxymethylglutaryl-CoA lyase